MDWFNFQVDGLEHVILDITTIIACVCLFTWLAKGVFERLRRRYEHQKRTWAECFFNALYEPLSIYVWFYAAAHIVSSVLIYTHSVFGEDLIYKMESVGGVIALWWFLMKWKRLLVQKMVVKSRLHEIVIDTAKIDAIDKVCTLAILLLVGLLMLEATGRGLSTIIAFGGIGGLALAFASQEIIACFFGGFMIYITQPFAVEDWILLPSLSVEGVVEEIGWYTTHIRSLDKQPMYIPNSLFSKLVVITRSRMSHRQIKETVGIRSEDYNKLRPITEEIEKSLRKHHDIDHSQPVIVRFDGYGPYTLDIYISAYTNKVDTAAYLRVKESVLFIIGDTIMKYGAEIPPPTQLTMNPQAIVPKPMHT